jgi:hypothetical protein
MKIFRWIAAAVVAYLIWRALAKSENYMPPGSYDSQFFFEQDSQIRENPWVGILQEKIYNQPKVDKSRLGNFGPAEDTATIPMYMIT